MILQELLKKPVEVVLENNIHEDILFEDQTVNELIERISNLVSSSTDSLDFLVVITDRDLLLKTAITNRELDSLLVLLGEESAENLASKSIQSLGLGEKIPLGNPISLETATIENVYNLFQSDLADILIVQNKDSKYVGKIKRNNFTKRLKLLLTPF